MRTRSEKYEQYIVHHHNEGLLEDFNDQTVYRFPNGYGASVIYGEYTYGLEIAVLEFLDNEENYWTITYDSGLTEDVFGYVEDLDGVLDDIFLLGWKHEYPS